MSLARSKILTERLSPTFFPLGFATGEPLAGKIWMKKAARSLRSLADATKNGPATATY